MRIEDIEYDVDGRGRNELFGSTTATAGVPGKKGGIEISSPNISTVAFSCSSNRTMSVVPMNEFDEAACEPEQVPAVSPSRHNTRLVFNAPVPPLKNHAANADGSG